MTELKDPYQVYLKYSIGWSPHFRDADLACLLAAKIGQQDRNKPAKTKVELLEAIRSYDPAALLEEDAKQGPAVWKSGDGNTFYSGLKSSSHEDFLDGLRRLVWSWPWKGHAFPVETCYEAMSWLLIPADLDELRKMIAVRATEHDATPEG
jgi:hypothetical protein